MDGTVAHALAQSMSPMSTFEVDNEVHNLDNDNNKYQTNKLHHRTVNELFSDASDENDEST
eukprot:11476213-Ditylum_brightwellii.AAC.1